MRFDVGNNIYVHEPTQALKDWCKSELTLDNPEYHKKVRMGLWLGGTPENICLYEKRGDDLILPFGCVVELRKLFPDVPCMSRIKPCEPFYYASGINLYPYQERAVKTALKARNGVIVMPCGAGKTQTALEIISILGIRTLWLTHTQDLLNQSLSRAKSVLNCVSSSYGTITGGKVNIGTGITFATVQTMSKLDLSRYKDAWGCIIVDECHKAIGSPTKVMQFYKVLSNLSCRYKFGITATPKRADGLEKSMFALIGDVICEISRDEVKDTTCPVKVEFIETGYMPNLDMALSGDGTINYAGLVDDLVENANRFNLISNSINKLNGSTLVLGNRVKFLQELNDAYEGKSVCLSAMGNSKAAKVERKEALRKLNDGEISCVFCTYQLAAEGLDCPNLRYVVFATPEKDPTRIQQASGRVGRKAQGKDCGIVIDFVDAFGMYKSWKKKREAVYKKLGYVII